MIVQIKSHVKQNGMPGCIVFAYLNCATATELAAKLTKHCFGLKIGVPALCAEEPSKRLRQSDSDDFVSIFDGKTLEGWHAVPIEGASDWTVGDGAIVGRSSAERLYYLVWKDEHLTDFELELRYRRPNSGNTGVEIRSQPDLTGKRPFEGYHADDWNMEPLVSRYTTRACASNSKTFD